MKTKLFFILSVLYCTVIYAQNNVLKKLNLIGNIKTIREYYKLFILVDGKIQADSIELTFQNTFNKAGNKIEDIIYTIDEKIDKKYEYITRRMMFIYVYPKFSGCSFHNSFDD